MIYKKTWFGWINFVIGAGFMSVFLYALFVSLFDFAGFSTSFFDFSNMTMSMVLSVAAVLLVIGLYFVMQSVKAYVHKFSGKGINVFLTTLTFAVFLLITAWIIYIDIVDFNAVKSGLSISEDSVFLKDNIIGRNAVAIIYGEDISFMNTLSYMYSYVCSFILRVFGIDLAVLFALEAFLKLLAGVFLFVTNYVLFGKMPAICGYGLMMILGTTTFKVNSLSELSLALAIVSLFAMIFALILKERSKGLMASNSNIILFILFGILFGFTVYLEPACILVPIAFIVLLLISKQEKNTDIAINRKALPTIVFAVCIIISFLCSIVLDAYLSHTGIIYIVNDIISRFGFVLKVNMFYPSDVLVECIVIVSLCLYAFLGFLYTENDVSAIPGLLLILSFLAYSWKVLEYDISNILYLLFGLLAGIGLRSFLSGDGVGRKVHPVDKSIEESGEIVLLEPVTDTTVVQETKSETVIKPSDEPVVSNEPINSNEPVKKVEFIENVLPIPKKHVKKSFDYKFETSEDMLKYDIDISDDDDFDI